MMEARKLLINLLYRATSQSSELPGWSHRETKKGGPPVQQRAGVIRQI